MKKIVKLSCMLFIICFAYLSCAYADDNASNVSFYQQYRGSKKAEDKTYGPYTSGYWDKAIAEQYDGLSVMQNPDGTYRYLSNRGCRLFSYAHALQRLTGEKANDQRQIDILAELLKVHRNPPSEAANTAYKKYIVETYGKKHGIKDVTKAYCSSEKKMKWEEIQSFFDNGGVIIFTSYGHIALAVDYVEKTIDGVTGKYILVIDSSAYSTAKRIDSGICYNGSFETKYVWDSKKPSWNGYGRLWITFSDFKACDWQGALTSITAKESTTEDTSDGKYQTAPDRIAYYHQYMKTDGKTTWNYHTNNTYWDEKLNSVYGLAISDGDGDTPNISGRGCSLLAYGHAIQWLDGKADATRQIEILAELVRKSKNPPTAEEIYGKYVESEYNATFGEKVTKWTEEYLRDVFDKDGVVIVCNKYSSGDNSGHVALAIGYRVHNGTFYVQMMDSTCRATLKRLPDGGASAKVYDFSAAANLTYSAGQYWVPLDQFSGIIKWSYSLIPNTAYAESLTVSTNYAELEIGESVQIVATVTPDNAVDKPVWWSDDESIATVSADGLITAVGLGSTEIRVSVESPYAEPGHLFETIWVDVVDDSLEEVNDAVELCTLNAKFTYDEDANTRKLPYATSEKLTGVTAGQTVVVTKLVQNRYNNIWAQLSDGSYLCFYDQSKGERYMTFVSTNALGVSDDAKMPTGDIPLATSFGLRGTITADMPIYSVTAKVTNRETEAVTVGPVTATSAKGAFTKSVTMNKALNGVNINDKMSFKKLTTAGYYSYEVLVQLGFTYAYNGEVFKFGAEQVVICSDFTAGSPDEEIILPDVPDDPMPEPILVERIDVTMDGTYGFYGDPCEFSWEVYPNDATDKSVTWTSSNEDVIKLQMIEQGTMKLCYVNCGMTEITVKANDGSGISKSYQVTVVPKLHYSWNLGNEVVVGKTIAGYLELSVEPSTANINIVGEDKNILDVKFQETSPGEYDIEVHGINPGNTLVLAQASSNGYLNSCWTDITVRQPVYVESIDIYGLPTEMKVGETADMYFVFNPEDHDCTSWGVLSGNPSMIEVQHEEAYWDEYGNYVYPVIACAPGTVTITVEADDGSEAVATHTITIKGSVLSGDANEDGLVNIYDVLLVLQYSAGWNVTLTTDNADVNNDGVIGPSDAVQILRYCAGGDLVSAMRALKDLLGGLDVSALEIVKQPVDQYVPVDQKAQFAVTVTGEPVAYQWYINRNDGKDWCKLNGAVEATYVTSTVDVDCDGFQYRCVITDVYGSELTSDVAVLHVALELPVTGDASTPVLWLALCVLSALGILFMSKRKAFR